MVKGSIHKPDAYNERQLETLAGTKHRLKNYRHYHVSVFIFSFQTQLWVQRSKREWLKYMYMWGFLVTVEGSKIINFDLTASNGLVHVIDTVMMPPTGSIVDSVTSNSNMSAL